MQYKDYYLIMGVERSATPDDIKRAHRKLARKYHPDVSKEKNAEAKFKEAAEAYAVLKDPEKRAAYDRLGANYQAGQEFQPPPDWAGSQQSNGDYSQHFQNGDGQEHSAFFDALFRSMGRGQQHAHEAIDRHGRDQHAKIQIDIEDAYLGATRRIKLGVPVEASSSDQQLQERTIEFTIPKGIYQGQHIRLAGQGGAGIGQGHAGDLYLDVQLLPHPLYHAHGKDVTMDLPIAPWEAALGCEVLAPTPMGAIQIKIPPGAVTGQKLRLKGRGLPSKVAGDFYFVLQIVLPPSMTETDKKAYGDFKNAFSTFKPREKIDAHEKSSADH
jgi:curved DNA-binding protein